MTGGHIRWRDMAIMTDPALKRDSIESETNDG